MSMREISIEINKDQEELGIGDVARVLKGIQDSIYHIGEFIYSKGVFRKSGKWNKNIEKRTKLTFKDLKKGSFIATFEGEPQQALWGKTLAEESIGAFGSIISALNYENEEDIDDVISAKIEDSLHKLRILKDIVEFWPGGENNYKLKMETQNFPSHLLENQRRQLIFSVAKSSTETKDERIFGILSMHRFLPHNEVEIRGPEGKIKCKYTKGLKEIIRDLEERPVRVTGMIEVDKSGNIKEMSDISEITLLEELSLNRIIVDEGELELKESLHIKIDFQDKEWILENEHLNIIASGRSYDEAITSFQDDFYFLYEQYYLGDSEKMVGKAIEIKEYLKGVLGG